MIIQSGAVKSYCDECGAEVMSTATEALVYHKHRWDLEYSCAACGNAWHEGGAAPVPQKIREILLRTNCPSRIALSPGTGRGAALLNVIRKVDGGSLGDAKVAAESMRSSGRMGTKVEIEVLKKALDAAGVDSTVSHPGDADAENNPGCR